MIHGPVGRGQRGDVGNDGASAVGAVAQAIWAGCVGLTVPGGVACHRTFLPLIPAMFGQAEVIICGKNNGRNLPIAFSWAITLYDINEGGLEGGVDYKKSGNPLKFLCSLVKGIKTEKKYFKFRNNGV